MNIKSNELLHSFYLRKCTVNGEVVSKSFTNLIVDRKSFGWRNHAPFYLPELFDGEPEEICNDVEVILKRHTLLPLYLPTMSLNLYIKMIDDHLTPINKRNYRINRTLSGLIRNRYTLNFCNMCMIEQIKKYGFHWHKLEWNFLDIKHCSIHGKPLKTLICKFCGYKFAKVADMLKGLQKGACSFCNLTMLKNSSFEDVTIKEEYWVAPTISDSLLFKKQYPIFSNYLIKSIINYVISEADKNLVYKISQSPLAQVIYDSQSRLRIKKFMNDEVDSLPANIFWQCVARIFKSLKKFDSYLKKNGVIKKMNANKMFPDIYLDFQLQIYIHKNEQCCYG